MTTGFEQRLRSEMEQVAVRPRPGLVREAYRGYRGRRRTARAVAATGTAAIAAGAGVGMTATGPGGFQADTTAYVVSHVGSALTATSRITYTSMHFTAQSGTFPGNLAIVRDTWRFGARYRTMSEKDGRPISESWVRTGHGKPTLVSVDYPQRTWGSSAYAPTQQETNTDLCHADGLPLFAMKAATAADWNSIVESGLRCGLFHVAGRQRADGIDAIKLTGRFPQSATVLWVDPHTYLPVRMATNVLVLSVLSANGHEAVTAKVRIWTDFRWLAPTHASLARLSATVPPGFRHVSK